MLNGWPASPVHVIPPILGFSVLLCLSLLSLLKGWRRRLNRLFAGLCLLGALLNADMALISLIREEALALRVDRGIHLLFVFSIPLYIAFIHAFLRVKERRWLEYAAWGYSLLLAAFVPTDFYFDGFYEYPFGRVARGGVLFPCFAAVIALTLLYCLTLLYRTRKQTQDNQRRTRIGYILGGLGGSALLLAFTILPVSGIPLYPPGNFSFLPALFLAYGLLRYDVLDFGSLIRQGTVYFLLTGVLTVLYILALFVFQSLFLSVGGTSWLLSLALAVMIVLLFNPIRAALQGLIDRLFFRGRYHYQGLLRELSGKLARCLRVDQIRNLLLREIAVTLQVERVHLLLRDKGGVRLFNEDPKEGEGRPAPEEAAAWWQDLEGREGPLTRAAAEWGRVTGTGRGATVSLFEILGVSLVVPIRSSLGLAGVIALGQKRSGQLFVDEDLELLMTLANQAATALENAASYEALEALNRTLEAQVAKRTAALHKALLDKERAQELLIRSESLAAIGQLVAGTAHELNNPISGAMSLVESSLSVLADGEAAKEQRDEIVEDLRFSLKELHRAAAIIRSLLDLSRQTQTYVEPVDINRALDDALRVLYNRYKRLPVVIEKSYDPALPAVEGNFANLGQVWINLLANALEALPDEGGRILLGTRLDQGQEGVVVTIRDTGRGIAPALIKDVFKPFFTTKPVGKGTGLGLYLSHEIIRRHGGQIRVESREGEGTTVIVELPCRRRAS